MPLPHEQGEATTAPQSRFASVATIKKFVLFVPTFSVGTFMRRSHVAYMDQDVWEPANPKKWNFFPIETSNTKVVLCL